MVLISSRVAVFAASCDVVKITVSIRYECSIKSVGPSCPMFSILYDLICVWISGIAMGSTVVLVKGTPAPEYAIIAWVWILLVLLMKFVFVSFPVKFPLKRYVTEGTPVAVCS